MPAELTGAVIPGTTRRALGRGSVLLVSAILVLFAAATIKTIPYGRALWDFYFIEDGAYRIGLGQVPHLQFAVPIGSLTLYLTFLAERLFPDGQPFVGLHALMWLLVMPPFAMLAPRFETFSSYCFAFALLALMVLVPFTVDKTSLSEISYFASYNRFATGILFLLGLWYVLPKSTHDAPLIAWLIGLLFFLKITAAVVAIVLLLAASVLRRTRWHPVAIGLGAVAMFCVVLDVGTGFVSAYLGNVLAMVGINRGSGTRAIAMAVFRNWLPLTAGAGLAALAVLGRWRGGANPSRGPIVIWFQLEEQVFIVDAMVLLAVALAAESQNTGGLGLVAAAAMLFRRDVASQDRERLIGTTILGASLLLPIIDMAVSRTLTMIYHDTNTKSGQPFGALAPGVRVPAATLAGAALFLRMSHEWLDLMQETQREGFFQVGNDPHSNAPAVAAAFAEDVIDAADVFRARGLRDTAHNYATLAFADPFTRMLRLIPAQGIMLVIEINRTVPAFTPEEASRYLAGADGLFVTRCALPNPGKPVILTYFQPVLDKEFTGQTLNACWDYYTRRHP